MLPADIQSRRQPHASVENQRAGEAQAEVAAVVFLCLAVVLQCGVPTFFGIGIALIALVTHLDIGFDSEMSNIQVVADLSKDLLCRGIVTTLQAIPESVEGNVALGAAVMTAIDSAQAQRQRPVLAQGVSACEPTVQGTVELITVHPRLGLAADDAQPPIGADSPISSQHQTFCRMLESKVSQLLGEAAAIADGLDPDLAVVVPIRRISPAHGREHSRADRRDTAQGGVAQVGGVVATQLVDGIGGCGFVSTEQCANCGVGFGGRLYGLHLGDGLGWGTSNNFWWFSGR
ncbi:hypothetical protein D3C78_1098210 [compost metagenome]